METNNKYNELQNEINESSIDNDNINASKYKKTEYEKEINEYDEKEIKEINEDEDEEDEVKEKEEDDDEKEIKEDEEDEEDEKDEEDEEDEDEEDEKDEEDEEDEEDEDEDEKIYVILINSKIIGNIRNYKKAIDFINKVVNKKIFSYSIKNNVNCYRHDIFNKNKIEIYTFNRIFILAYEKLIFSIEMIYTEDLLLRNDL